MSLSINRAGSGRALRAVAGLALVAGLRFPAHAHDMDSHAVMAGPIEITDGFARATLPNAPVGGGYVTLYNTGDADETLIGAESPVSPNVQLHEMSMENDMMRMAPVEGGIVVPAGERVTLAPGGLHLMFIQITEAFEEGATVPVTLTFEKASSAEIMLDVRGIAAGAGDEGNGHGDGAGHDNAMSDEHTDHGHDEMDMEQVE